MDHPTDQAPDANEATPSKTAEDVTPVEQMPDVTKYARALIAAGIAPVPVKFGTKVVIPSGWKTLRIREDEVVKYFRSRKRNIAMILGTLSDGLTDVDLDCQEAIRLAQFFLPRTAATFGRASARASHWI